jgi:hypothetical protein
MDIKELVKAARTTEIAYYKDLVRLYGVKGKPVKGIKEDAQLKASKKAYKEAAKALLDATSK